MEYFLSEANDDVVTMKNYLQVPNTCVSIDTTALLGFVVLRFAKIQRRWNVKGCIVSGIKMLIFSPSCHVLYNSYVHLQ